MLIYVYVNIPVLHKEQFLDKNFLEEEIIAATCEIATAPKKIKQTINNAESNVQILNFVELSEV